jgi:glycosyltransferase involved in cell wall biosynthesis
MKIGIISRAFPHDPEKMVWGFYKRLGMFIDALKDLGELEMLFYVNQDLAVNPSFVIEMEKRLASIWDARLKLELCKLAPWKSPKGFWQEYISPALSIKDHPPYQQMAQREQIDAVHRILSRKPDIIFIHRLSCMVPVLLSNSLSPQIYFDLDDIEHVAFERSINQPPRWRGKPLQYLRLPILRLFERRAIRFSHTTFVCSEYDKNYLSKTYGSKNVVVIPNAIHIPKVKELPDNPILLFLGVMSYAPNAQAADYLIKNVWPMILSTLPSAKLFIAGAFPERIPSFSDHPHGVEFLGFVDELDKMYNEVKVVCCPIFSGGGTRIKILEAAAYGKPVVSTTIGAEGISLQDGEEILLRDDPESFANACIYLLDKKSIATKIGRAAHSVIIQHYDRNSVVKRIKMHLIKSANCCSELH